MLLELSVADFALLERLRFRRMLIWLQHYAEKLFGFRDFAVAERPMPP